MKVFPYQWNRWVSVLLLLGVGFFVGWASPIIIHHLHGSEIERETIEFSRLTSPYLEGAGERNGDSRLVHAGSTLIDRRYWISAKTYAAMFRVLYNSNFLGRAMSEYALDLLTRGYFQGGLRRFIPKDIQIASKFGFVRQSDGEPRAAELHECGIIYQPGFPYVLCVMTRSEQASEVEMAKVIADVSRIIWQVKTE